MLLGGKGRFGLPTQALAATMSLASESWAQHEMRDWVVEFPHTAASRPSDYPMAARRRSLIRHSPQ